MQQQHHHHKTMYIGSKSQSCNETMVQTPSSILPVTLSVCRGGLQYGWEKTPDAKKAWIAVVIAVGTTLISIFAGIPLIKRNVQRDLDAQEAAQK